jgi:DNA-binding transcriptional LysR family regulator
MTPQIKDLAWDDFRLVKAVADARSLPGAAALIGVNHSTVFRRLAHIEQTLGVPLFERHRSGYAPTAAGEEMIMLAERMDEGVAAFARRVAGQELTPAGELRVTTNDTLLVHLLTPLLARFRERCPDIALDVLLSNQPLNLSKRDADVAVRATDSPPESLVGRRVATIAWALYGRAIDFPDRRGLDQNDLYRRPWVSLGDNLGAMKVVKFVKGHVRPEKIVYRVNTVLGLAEAVEAGIGIGHVPCFIADVRPALVRLADPDPELSAGLWLLTHPDLRRSPRVRVFLDFLADEIVKLRRLIEGTQSPPDAT